LFSENKVVLLLKDRKNTKKQGDVGMAVAIWWLSEAGYHVSIPLTDSNDYDLVIESEGKFSSVQVKTTYFKNPAGNYRANLRVLGGNRSGTGKVKNFDAAKVDYLFVVTESNEKYFIPTSHLDVVNCITLCGKYEQYRVT
jgi:PD-(D/E)XK endonuclease